MDSKQGLGIGLLVVGIWNGATMITELSTHYASLSLATPQILGSIAGLIGSISMVVIGLGVLLGWNSFSHNTSNNRMGEIILALIALIGFGIGIGFSMG